jgi:2-iminobutanoate/2-iminopropanoate deaminase
MSREVIRVEPLSTYLERWRAPTSAVIRHGDTIYVSGLPPFDPRSGDIVAAPIPQQTEIVLEQMKLCLETAGSSLDHVLKCNLYCTSVEQFATINEIYARYFTTAPPARIFVAVPAWPGRFDIEIDCVAATARAAKVQASIETASTSTSLASCSPDSALRAPFRTRSSTRLLSRS